jgi:hypothetical protein
MGKRFSDFLKHPGCLWGKHSQPLSIPRVKGSLAALHVSGDIFAHHQEHFNCIYSFWFYTRMPLPAGVMEELGLKK